MTELKYKICPACGEEFIAGCVVGSYTLCRHCSSRANIPTALEIAEHKHHDKLENILARLDGEVYDATTKSR